MTTEGAGRQQSALGYIPAIDGLRAVAVGSVMVFHLWPAALPGGFTGVDVFFVISGFVVTGSVIGKRFARLGELLAWFYARRLVRIMPALIAMLLATTFASQLLIPASWLSNSLPQVGVAAFVGLSNVLLATDTDSYFGPQAAFNPFTHTWSLGVEEQFYLLFPLLLFARTRLGAPMPERRLLLLVAGLSLASFAIAAVLPQRYAFYLILSRFWELGAGMLLCLTRDRWRPRLAEAGRAAQTALALASMALVAAGLATGESRGFPFPLALLPVLGAAGLIATACALPGALPTRLLEARAMVIVGKLSYSLYLWHWPVFVLFRWTTGLHTLPLQLAALALACALATASYLLVEQPLRASPRIAALPRPRVVRIAVAAMLGSAAAGALLFAVHDRLTLSVTRDHATWYADEDRPLDPARSHCRVREEVTRLAGGKATRWIPEGCRVRPAGFAVLAIGDSHNMAYAPAYRQLAAELGVTVHAWFRAGCPFAKLHGPDDPQRRCGDWQAALLADYRSRARPGDVVFLPGLRLTRLTNQFENDSDLARSGPERVTPEALAEARGLMHALAARGTRLVIEAPKPLFRSPAFRCADWFNRANPICAGGLAMPRGEMEARRGPVLAAMVELAGSVPGLAVWDPFAVLCPGDPCRAIQDGRPRYLDGDHLSGHGNDVVYPGLKAAIVAAAGR